MYKTNYDVRTEYLARKYEGFFLGGDPYAMTKAQNDLVNEIHSDYISEYHEFTEKNPHASIEENLEAYRKVMVKANERYEAVRKLTMKKTGYILPEQTIFSYWAEKEVEEDE